MSEFYGNMDIDNNHDKPTIETNMVIFKEKYFSLKKELIHLCESLILFDSESPFQKSEIIPFLTIDNIMELCRICHDYFLCRNQSILLSAQHILDKIVITDDSPKDELHMYFTAYIFMTIEVEPHKHDVLFDLIMDVSNYYATYLHGHEKLVFDMITLEESLSTLSF